WKKLGTKEPFVPQYIKGDLDSVRHEVSDFFASRGSVVIKDLDQDSNDLDKCMALLETLQSQMDTGKGEKLNVLVLGAMGGRFDQEMQNINALYRWSKVFARMTLYSDCTSAMLLWPGKHSIRPNFDIETRTCGLIPIGGTCNELTTEGLKWNLSKFSTAFGGLVSSSNHCLANEILVENSDPLIWTTELKTTN
ncbi:thiamin pyrophosphokinase, partial [Thraustotheca clavata]